MKTELNEQDRERIEQKARKSVFADGQYDGFIAAAEYATIYEREQQVALQTENSIYFQERNEAWKLNAQLEAERSELIEKMTELLKAFNDSDKNYADWVATKELYSAFTGVDNLLERLNSLKTK